MVEILQIPSYKVCSIVLPKFATFVLFIPILRSSTIILQTPCCYGMTTSDIRLSYGLKANRLMLSTKVPKIHSYADFFSVPDFTERYLEED